MKPFPTIALIATLLISSHRAAADVLDEVPADAAIIMRVQKLDKTSAKLAKLYAAIGLLDSPESKDPIKSWLQSAHWDRGVDFSGDLAAVGCGKSLDFAGPNNRAFVLIPVSDYTAFLSNFSDAKTGADGITTTANASMGIGIGAETFIAHWGKYAAMSPSKDLIAKPPAGVKLTGRAAEEFSKRDFGIYVRMDQVRDTALAKLKGDDEETVEEMMSGLPQVSADEKPLEDAFERMLLGRARQFLTDDNAVALGIDLADDGVLFSAVADFKPGSTLATFAASLTAASPPALAGLPNEPYVALGGATLSPEMKKQIIATLIDPMASHLDPKDDTSKPMGELLTALRGIFTSTDTVAGGVIGKPGEKTKAQYQVVRIANGDAAAIKKSYVDGWTGFCHVIRPPGRPSSQPAEMRTVLKPDSATVDGARFDLFSVHLGPPDDTFDFTDVNSLVGPNAFGGWIGAASPRSVLIVTGVNTADPLFHDSLAAAKAGKDTLSASKAIGATAAHLPPSRPWEMFAYPQRINAMNGGDLPAPDEQPIGVSFAGSDATLRVDIYMPAREMMYFLPFPARAQTTLPETQPGQ